ncbi:MAG: 4Fe-4S binding protein, partial [Methanosarcinales archaeon]|nr:4Fe-4S binding protein [Methanosarcinales archaeon]
MNVIRHHEELCTHCNLCIEICPMYNDIAFLDDLFGYLNGTHDTVPSEDIFRCLTC